MLVHKMPLLENRGTETYRYQKCQLLKMSILVLRMLVLSNDDTGKCRYQKTSVLNMPVPVVEILILKSAVLESGSSQCHH